MVARAWRIVQVMAEAPEQRRNSSRARPCAHASGPGYAHRPGELWPSPYPGCVQQHVHRHSLWPSLLTSLARSFLPKAVAGCRRASWNRADSSGGRGCLVSSAGQLKPKKKHRESKSPSGPPCTGYWHYLTDRMSASRRVDGPAAGCGIPFYRFSLRVIRGVQTAGMCVL